MMNSNGATSLVNSDFQSVDLMPQHGQHQTPTRARRTSNTSMTSDTAGNLFPIYESPQQVYCLPSDLESSTAGSEWEDNGSSASAQLSAVTKEQMFQMLQKTRARYHKYKGRYADVAKAYTELEEENKKVKNVMHQTQDKALRRVSELKEQCSLEQKAKRHLEEELRADIEEKQHVISALETKVNLLKSSNPDDLKSKSNSEDTNGSQSLIDLDSNNGDPDKVASLEGRLDQ